MERPFKPFPHFSYVLQFCRRLVCLVELGTEGHILRHSNKKDECFYPHLNKCFLLLLQYAGQNTLQGFVLFFYHWCNIYVVIVLRFNGALVAFILSWSGQREGVLH